MRNLRWREYKFDGEKTALYELKGQWWWRRLPAVNSEYTSLPSHFVGTILFTGDHYYLWLLGSQITNCPASSLLILIIYMLPPFWQLVGKSDFASYLPFYYLQIMYILSVTKRSFFFAVSLQMFIWIWSVSMRSKISNGLLLFDFWVLVCMFQWKLDTTREHIILLVILCL